MVLALTVFPLIALTGRALARHYEAALVLQDFGAGKADSRLKRTAQEPLRKNLSYMVSGRVHNADFYLPTALEGCGVPGQVSASHCLRSSCC